MRVFLISIDNDKGTRKKVLSQQPHRNENKTPRHNVIQGNEKPLEKDSSN